MSHVRKRGPRRYLAEYRGPDGRRHSKTFERKIDADRWLAEQSVDVASGRWVDPKAGRVTFGAYAADYVRTRPVRDSTRTRYEGFLTHTGELGAVPIAELRPSTMRAWQHALTTRVAVSTAGTIRGVVASILKAAVVDRVIAVSPLDGVPLPPRPPRQLVRPYPAERVVELRDVITDRYAAAIMLGAGCGPRRGEAFGLTVDRVDFLRRTVTFDRQVVDSVGGWTFGPLKTAASVRVVPAPQLVLDALAAHLAKYPAGPDGLIFTAPRGGPVDRKKLGAAWRDAEVRLWARATGHQLGTDDRIPAATLDAWTAAHPAGHGHRFHELRHFYASTLIADGQSVKVVQARLGHATAAETLDTYSHLWPDDEDRTRAALDAALAPNRKDRSNDGRP